MAIETDREYLERLEKRIEELEQKVVCLKDTLLSALAAWKHSGSAAAGSVKGRTLPVFYG